MRGGKVASVAALLLAACSTSAPPVHSPDGYDILYTGSVWGGNLAVANGTVYFTTFTDDDSTVSAHSVRAVSRDGGSVDVLWRSTTAQIFGYGLAIAGGDLYWSEALDGDPPAGAGFFRAPIGGGDRTQLGQFQTGGAPYNGVVADETAAFASNGDILTVPIAGTSATTLSTAPGANWLGLQGELLYFTSGQSLMSLPRTGGAPSTLASFSTAVANQFDLDRDAAYVQTDGAIVRVPLDGSAQSMYPVGTGTPSLVVKGADAFYVDAPLDTGDDQILRVPLSGDPVQVLATNLHYVFSLAIDDRYLYFAQCACSHDGFIGRIALP